MQIKDQIKENLITMKDQIIAVSHEIHQKPELAFEEFNSSKLLIDKLNQFGFTVEHPTCDLPTAFIAKTGKGPLHIAICAEYDALPEIGHACGHNIIAAIALGAGMILRELVDELNLSLRIIGTPAEEKGGGKILMLERGAFKSIHAAMMVHPAPFDMLEPNIIAALELEVFYTGKEAHASAFPEKGINALDAMTIAQTAIGLLRQQMSPSDRVHGIITKGGDAPNIIPARTSARYVVRSKTMADLKIIREKIIHCFEAGALATGAKLKIIEKERAYSEMNYDKEITLLYQKNAEALGRVFTVSPEIKDRFLASTDMGNVSLQIPSIHPLIGIDSGNAVNHQAEFAKFCKTASADKAILDGALAIAWTVIDIARDNTLRERLIKNK